MARNVKAVEVAGVPPMPEEGIRKLFDLHKNWFEHDTDIIIAHK